MSEQMTEEEIDKLVIESLEDGMAISAHEAVDARVPFCDYALSIVRLTRRGILEPLGNGLHLVRLPEGRKS